MGFDEYKNNTENYYKQKAWEYQEKYGLSFDPNPKQSGHNDEVDAFRHAFLQGSFTWKARVAGKTVSSDIAKYIGDDHEKNPKNPISEKNMDLWNNDVGRKAAISLERKLGPKYYTMSQKEFEDMLAAELVKQIRSGKLVTDLDDKRNYKDSPQNPYSDENKTNSTQTSPFNTNSKAGQVFASYEDGLWPSNPIRDLQQQSSQQGNGKYANVQKNAMFERLGIEDMHAKNGHLMDGPWVKDNYPISDGNEWVRNSMTGNVFDGRTLAPPPMIMLNPLVEAIGGNAASVSASFNGTNTPIADIETAIRNANAPTSSGGGGGGWSWWNFFSGWFPGGGGGSSSVSVDTSSSGSSSDVYVSGYTPNYDE